MRAADWCGPSIAWRRSRVRQVLEPFEEIGRGSASGSATTRILYEVDDEGQLVTVGRVATRGRAYR